ncbi:MAG: phenylalanine--tRNA ligase beta subunit-related protein [Planctomycetota bacterium]
MLEYAPHPLLHAAAFKASFPVPFTDLTTPDAVASMLAEGWLDANADGADTPGVPCPGPEAREELRRAARDLLRHGGHRPTGRGKPSSEYLVRASTEGGLPRINLGVDCCNAVSLASGLPISVVDLDRARAPFRVDVVESGSYVFNASGQEIRLDGLLCLFDADGPCANAVKDSQRTKTHDGTKRTLTVLWAPTSHAEHADRTLEAYMATLRRFGDADVERVA